MTKHVRRVAFGDLMKTQDIAQTCCEVHWLSQFANKLDNDFEKAYAVARRMNAMVVYCQQHIRDLGAAHIAWLDDEKGLVVKPCVIAAAARCRLLKQKCWPKFAVGEFTAAIISEMTKHMTADELRAVVALLDERGIRYVQRRRKH